MQGEVTNRFINCINYLKESHLIPSIRQFALNIDIHPQCISDIFRAKRDVNSDIIHKAVMKYKLNPVYIYTGEGHFLIGEASHETRNTDPILTVVTDNEGDERIVHVPIAAQAGYGSQIHDPHYFEDLQSFSLPGDQFRHQTHRCFDVAGDSMEPSIFSGDKVVCSFVEKENWFASIRNNYVYVLVTHTSVLVKRVHNNLKKNGTLTLISDNNFYQSIELELKDIKEIWQVSLKISPFMPSPSHIRNGLHTEVDLLKDTISDQGKLIQSLNNTIEKLLKQNRSSTIR